MIVANGYLIRLEKYVKKINFKNPEVYIIMKPREKGNWHIKNKKENLIKPEEEE